MSHVYFSIGDFIVKDGVSPYIIAEIGVNHEGDLNLAKKLIDQAHAGGAHAVKFQTYKADKIASKNSPAYWDQSKEPTSTQHALFKKYDSFGPDEYKELHRYCTQIGIHFASTPFDLDAVDFLQPLVPFFKIASADITNVPLLRKVAKSGKPVILSTGASTLPEIEYATDVLKAAGAKHLALLHCVLNYPTSEDDANLSEITQLKKVFPDVAIGYSDHVVPDANLTALEVATLLGATILEKHFTHDKTLPGNDHYHAMNETDLRSFVEKLASYRKLIGEGKSGLDNQRAARLHARRSIVAARNILKGERLTEEMLIPKRPAHGISPIHWDSVIGAIATRDISADTLLTWDMIELQQG